MNKTPSLQRLCAASVAICCLMLSAVPSAHAGKSKLDVGLTSLDVGLTSLDVGLTSGQHVNGGRGFSIGHDRHFQHGHHKRNRFHKHDERLSFTKRRKHKRHNVYVPTYYYRYRRGYRYRDYPRSEPSYRPEKTEVAQPYQDRPVTPKWVHVGGIDSTLGASTVAEPYAGGDPRRNCLSVKTEITIDGKPMDAFGEACLLADGGWEFKPLEQSD